MTSAEQLEQDRDRRSIILILLLGFLVYFNTFSGSFLFDDGYTIIYNPKVNEISLERLKLGRPVIGILNALNHLADGGNPRGYHAVNLGIHLLAALTLFGIIRRTLKLERWPESVRGVARPIALAIASLWVVHPLQTSSVTYIIQRCESLMGLFYLLSLYMLIRGATSSRTFFWYVGSIVSAFLGGACKEVIVTAPIVLLAYDWVFLGESVWRILRKRGWYYLLLTTALVLSFLYWSGKLVVSGTNSFALGFDYPWFTWWEYLMSQTHVIIHYLRLTVWPTPLCFDYQDWPVTRTWRDCWLPGSILSVTLLFALIAVWRRSWVGFVIFAFFAILGPTSSILPIQDLIFEHRMYVPLALVITLIVASVYWILTRLAAKGLLPCSAITSLGVIVTAAVVALGAVTILRNHDYRSRLAMWSDVVRKRPGDVRAMTEVAAVQYQGATAAEARALITRAVEIMPNYADAHYYLGVMLFDANELTEAAQQFNIASQLRPEGSLYFRHEGMVYLVDGKPAAAIVALREALKRDPNDTLASVFLALAELENGDEAASDAIFAELRERNDGAWGTAFNNARMNAYRDQPNQAQKRLAILYAQAACKITEDKNLELLDMLAVAYAVSGKFEDAEREVTKAIRLAEKKENEAGVKILKYRLERYKKRQMLRFGESR